MMRFLLPVLTLSLLACGDKAKPPPSGFDPAEVLLEDWEFFPLSPTTVDVARGRVTTPDGKPASKATVEVYAMPRRPVTPPLKIADVAVDGEGRFTVRDFPLNGWVFAKMEGFGGQLISGPAFLRSLGSEVVVPLRPAGRFSGVARFEDGQPVRNYGILAMGGSNDWFGRTETDTEGRFAFTDVPLVPVTVYTLVGAAMGRAQEFALEEGTAPEITVIARRTPPLSGQIIDESTGLPVAGAVVRTLVQGEVYVLTDAAGQFQLDGAYSGGLYVHADNYGEARYSSPPDRPAGQLLTIKLAPAMVATGRVVDESGAPVAGVRISAVPQPDRPGSPFVRGPLTRADGSFAFTWISAPLEGVTGVLTAEAPGYLLEVSRPRQFTRGGRASDVMFTLRRPSAVRMRLVDEDGQPWADVPVMLTRTEQDLPAGLAPMAGGAVGLPSGPTGVVLLGGLRPGAFEMAIDIPQRVPFRQKVTVRAGEQTELGDVPVVRGKTIAGRLLDYPSHAANRPVVTVAKEDLSDPLNLGITDDGEFRIFGLTPGRYVLAVSARVYEPWRKIVAAGDEEVVIELSSLLDLSVRVIGTGPGQASGVVQIERRDGPPTGRGPVSNPLEGGGDTVMFRGLPRGRYQVRAFVGQACGRADVELAGNATVAVEVELARGVTISGRVIDGAGNPVGLASVEADAGPEWGVRIVTTDDQGQYRFDGIPPRPIVLRSRPEGNPRGEVKVDGTAGAALVADLMLPAGGTMMIFVASGAGVPVPGVSVWLKDAANENVELWVASGRSATTDAQGRVILTGILPGTYTLSICVDGEVVERRQVALEPARTLEVRVEVAK